LSNCERSYRVLKKREGRLIREQNGLKSLISGLVGGPALLKEWETEWRANFGGEETDEVELEPVSEDDEGDDEDGDEGCKEEDEGRARKKVKIMKIIKKPKKVVAAPATVQAALVMARNDMPNGVPSPVVPEKRKRGRPRKVPQPEMGPEVVYSTNRPPSEVAPAAVVPEEQAMHQLATSHQGQGQASQYLLATFALFSFFNSPLTHFSSPSSAHTHTGTVLAHKTIHTQTVPMPVEVGLGWQDVIQAFHLFVSALVLFSILAPWLPSAIKGSKLMSYILSPFSALFLFNGKSGSSPLQPPPPSSSLSERKVAAVDRPRLVDALDSSCRGTPGEVDQLRSALGVPPGLMGILHGVFGGKINGKDQGFEQKGLAQRAWVRLGELAVLDGMSSSPFVPTLRY
jgi:hypothetical protein